MLGSITHHAQETFTALDVKLKSQEYEEITDKIITRLEDGKQNIQHLLEILIELNNPRAIIHIKDRENSYHSQTDLEWLVSVGLVNHTEGYPDRKYYINKLGKAFIKTMTSKPKYGSHLKENVISTDS